MTSKLLAICYRKGRIGCAYYDEKSKIVNVLYDVDDDEPVFRNTQTLMARIDPTLVLLRKNEDINLRRFLEQYCCMAVNNDDSGGEHLKTFVNEQSQNESTVKNNSKDSKEMELEEEGSDDDDDVDIFDDLTTNLCELHEMPVQTFDNELAKNRISNLFGYSQKVVEERNIKLASRMDLNSINAICAFGALLKYLDVARIGVEHEDCTVKTPIVDVKFFTINDMVEINAETRKALQIFGKRYHSSTFKTSLSDHDRNFTSLFDICNKCRSSYGKKLLRCWFEFPTSNTLILKSRVDIIDFFMQDSNSDVTNFLRSTLGHIYPLKLNLKRARSGRMSVGDWRRLYSTCGGMLKAIHFIESKKLKTRLDVAELLNSSDEIVRVTAIIAEMMNFEESRVENRFVINKGIDGNLDCLKETYANLPAILTDIAKKESVALNVQSCCVTYVPMFGFLLAIPASSSLHNTSANDLDIAYELDGMKYMKNGTMRTLDVKIGDIKMEIVDAESAAALRLQSLLCKLTPLLLRSLNICATLDCLISLALTAREYNWCRPVMVDESLIDVDSSRHPLCELFSKKKFVPNPIRSGGEKTKVKIITGPNASGKSVYLKQVGITVFLAHIGSFVPAERARIGLFDRIDSRMYALDSITDNMSSFTKDISQVSQSLRHSSGRSLVLIDEFGKGTVSEVGQSLLASSLNYWIKKGADHCPHVFVSTHFHKIHQYIESDENIVSFHAFETIKSKDGLEFLYELVDGYIDSSFSSFTARQMGISVAIVQRSIEILELLKADRTLDSLAMNPADENSLAKMTALIDAFAEWDFKMNSREFINLASSLLETRNHEKEIDAHDHYESDDAKE